MLFPLSPLHLFCARGRKFAVACHLFYALLVLERCRCLYSSFHCLAFRPLLHKEACGQGTPTVSSQNVEKLPLSGGSWWVPLLYPEQHLRLEEVGGGHTGQWPPAVLWTTCRLPEQHAGSLVIPQFVSNYTTGRTSLRPLRSA